ncbi:hypothetical protein ACFQMM_17725 [Saliphagus sp. GCM10025308]
MDDVRRLVQHTVVLRHQLVGPNPEDPGTYTTLALVVKEAAFYFGILGAVTFWALIPAGRRVRTHYAENN